MADGGPGNDIIVAADAAFARTRKRMRSADGSASTPGSHGPSSGSTSRADIVAGANEVGRGYQIEIPRSVPVEYNDRFTTELKYVDFYNGEVALGARDTQIWRPFSTFDPDFTNVGHQPKGRDLWAGIYTHYAVLACEYDIQVFNNYSDSITFTAVSTAGQDLGLLGANISITTVQGDIGLAMGTLSEMKGSHFEVVTPKAMIKDDGTSGFTRFHGTITPGDYKTGSINDDGDDMWTAVGSNPNVTRFLGLSLEPIYSSNPAGNNEAVVIQWTAVVKLKQTVQFRGITDTLRQSAS